MKNLLLTALATLGLTAATMAQNLTSTCAALQQTIDFSSSDPEPSLKKLKKMVGKATKDEILEYSIYLHEYLNNYSFKTEDYEKLRALTEKRVALVQDYIIPLAEDGNLRSIGFLTSRGPYAGVNDPYWENAKALNVLQKHPVKNSAEKFTKYQLKFVDKTEGDKYYYMNANNYILAEDSLLKSYFLDFNKTDLRRVRDTIDNRIIWINKIKKDFNFGPINLQNSAVQIASVFKKIPLSIYDPSFCLSFSLASIRGSGELSIVPVAFNGRTITIDAVAFLEVLRGCIDIILVDENPHSLAQLLFDFNNGKMATNWTFNYLNPKSQYFVSNKQFGPAIFKLLSAALPYDTNATNVDKKTYYLRRAAEIGAKDAYYNLACYYQVLYYRTNKQSYNDSCISFLEKLIPAAHPGALTLKGIKVFNGEGYIKNKEEGIKLITKAKSLGDNAAFMLLDSLPKKVFRNVKEGYYVRTIMDIKYPWDFKVKCSNGCGKYSYPEKIIFGRSYKKDDTFPRIERAEFFINDLSNPIVYFSDNDLKNTFSIAQFGFNNEWKHVMCSGTCQLEHENRNNKNFEEIKNKRYQIDNEEIKCVACSNIMKRKDMLSISDCPCYMEDGRSINVSFTQSYDLHGDYEPKACSSECQINYCKTKCVSKGFTSKY